MGTDCEETQSFLQLPETLAQLRTRLLDIGLSFVNQLLLKGQSLRGLEFCSLQVAPPNLRWLWSLPACLPFPGTRGSGTGQASLWKDAEL